MRIVIDVDPELMDHLWNRSQRDQGYPLRDNPRKAWTLSEKKQSIRHWIIGMAKQKRDYET